jgi:hypothetical protein
MAFARLQCMVKESNGGRANRRVPEQALPAQDYARESVELVSQTQDRRLLARVHVWYGRTFSNAFFNDLQVDAFPEAESPPRYPGTLESRELSSS